MPRSLGEVHQVPLTLINAGEGRVHPVYVDKEPRSTPFEARSQRAKRTPRSHDIYANATFLHDALAHLHAYALSRHDYLAPIQILVDPLTSGQALQECVSSGTSLAHKFIMNAHDKECIVRWEWRKRIWLFALPPCSGFILTNLLSEPPPPRLLRFAQTNGGVDLILLDPPWPNRSAQRAWQGRQSVRRYRTMDDIYDLWLLRPWMEALLQQHTLVAVWVTNHPKVQDFVRSKWFPGLGLRHHATWAWLKLTAPNGQAPQLLIPVGDWSFRRPYEVLLIGSRQDEAPVSRHHLLLSVPLGHSCKPNVCSVLRPQGGRVVELFARHVSRGAPWHVSVGDEAICGNAQGYDDTTTAMGSQSRAQNSYADVCLS